MNGVRAGRGLGGSTLEKLTNVDVQELSWWFATPPPASEAGRLAAQTYDPRTGGAYDRTTDMRLENLVQTAVSKSQSDWSRVKRTLDRVAELRNGRSIVEILRRAFAPLPSRAFSTDDFRFPEVAIITPALLSHAAAVARADEHVRLLEVTQLDAVRDGCSPMTIACRVWESDRRVLAQGIVVSDDMVRRSARRALERTVVKKPGREELALRVAVKLEMQQLVDVSGDAYRRARAELGATRRADRAAQRREAAAFLDEQLGKNRKREVDRIEAKLRRAS